MSKILFFSLLLGLTSCSNNKLYTYVELTNSSSEKKEIFSAKNDTLAYLLAYEKYCISLVANEAVASKTGYSFNAPVGFKLINQEGMDLTEEITFTTKEQKEQEISNRITSTSNNALAKMSPSLPESDSLGIWEIMYFVDEFDEPTKDGYITNKEFFKGEFSNSATDGSELLVKLVIPRKSDVQIFLYEYGNSLVKGYDETYSVSILDKNKVKYKLSAFIYDSDRLRFEDSQSEILHKIINSGGVIKFVITNTERSFEAYKFSIDNADKYDVAYRTLFKK